MIHQNDIITSSWVCPGPAWPADGRSGGVGALGPRAIGPMMILRLVFHFATSLAISIHTRYISIYTRIFGQRFARPPF